ncbi:ATP-dependent RNA helicase vasa isoform A [Trichostrongylus colubriformis]|uniref:RNA helicase n=1 Tax=Trichostrongylus colubriformis TaxID=6319 RepID=A0AAN8IVD6_TRICO
MQLVVRFAAASASGSGVKTGSGFGGGWGSGSNGILEMDRRTHLVQEKAGTIPAAMEEVIGRDGNHISSTVIVLEIIECTSVADKKEKFFELLNIDLKNYEISKEADVFKKKTMVFVSRKLFADTLGVLLSECGIPSTTIHGDRIQNQRSEAINEFKRGKKPVLIATAVGERGLDIKGVDHVINYDLPTNGQDYVHRIGRTGRVGNPGRATSLYLSEENKELAQSLVEILTEADQDVPEFLANDAKGGNARFGGFSRFGGDCEANNGAVEEDWD